MRGASYSRLVGPRVQMGLSPPRAVTFATALVRILGCKVGAKGRDLWPRHDQVLPPTPGATLLRV